MKLVLKSVSELRIENNLTQSQLALKSKVPQSKISEIESGTRHMTNDVVEKIANIFRVKSWDLHLGQELKNNGLVLEDRYKALKLALDNPKILIASKSLNKTQKQLDFGNRDSFGRKLLKIEVQKRAEKSLDLGSRDNFGIVRKTIETDDDEKLVDILNRDEKEFEKKLKKLLAKRK